VGVVWPPKLAHLACPIQQQPPPRLKMGSLIETIVPLRLIYNDCPALLARPSAAARGGLEAGGGGPAALLLQGGGGVGPVRARKRLFWCSVVFRGAPVARRARGGGGGGGGEGGD
jgi:hypothetical protein